LNPEKKEFLPPKVQGGFFYRQILNNLVFLGSGRGGVAQWRTFITKKLTEQSD